jgi:uncharacterized protein DUF6089
MKKLFIVALVFTIAFRASAQVESTVLSGEIGIMAGASQYFGDLNPDMHFNTPKPAVGIFFRKQFGNYIAARVQAMYTQLGYSDIYNTQNEFEHRRNLSFNTNIWELALLGDFNFFKFIPGDAGHRYTPYITFGLGIFSYDPYAYYQGQKVYLRPLGTEGQGSAAFPDRKPYSTMAFCIPLGIGFKYNINPHLNWGFEITYRFTTTDYIDDVSTTYAGINNFPMLPNGSPSLAGVLQDRSSETGVNPIGTEGKQRGYSNQNDGYLTATLTLSFNLTSYKCPSPSTDNLRSR